MSQRFNVLHTHQMFTCFKCAQRFKRSSDGTRPTSRPVVAGVFSLLSLYQPHYCAVRSRLVSVVCQVYRTWKSCLQASRHQWTAIRKLTVDHERWGLVSDFHFSVFAYLHESNPYECKAHPYTLKGWCISVTQKVFAIGPSLVSFDRASKVMKNCKILASSVV